MQPCALGQPRLRSEFTAEYIERARVRFQAFCTVQEDGHWIWTGSRSSNGRHGWFRLGSYNCVVTHRAAWLLWRGDLRDGHVVIPCAHGQGLCVSPEHLEERSATEHRKTMTAAKLAAQRLLHPPRKLTEQQVRQIYRLSRSGWSNRQLGARFNVASSNISHITTGRLWKGLGLVPFRRVGRRSATESAR